MSHEDRMDAMSDYNAEQQAEGFSEGFAKAKELIRNYIVEVLSYSANVGETLNFIDELEGQ